QNLRSVDRLFLAVEGRDGGGDHVVGHGHVDFASQFDEAGAEVKLLRLPGKIKRIDRNTVSAQTRPGIKCMEAERLGGGGVDDLPDVEVHAQAEHLKFVDQRDVNAAIDVLQQLGHLRGRRRGDGNGAAENRPVKRGGDCAGLGIESANHLGNVVTSHLRV